ncbi:MAG: hypothetical protein FWE53_02425 [Firmicutes bacterium]|nr:hypothetical protein [Bacillota bacterium]
MEIKKRTPILATAMMVAVAMVAGLFGGGLINAPITVYAASSGATIDVNDSTTASGTGWTYSSNAFTIEDGANVTITGTTTTNRIIVAASATVDITLDNADIQPAASMAFDIANTSTVNLTLVGANILKSDGGVRAGLRVPAGATLTIGGNGSLTATGSGGAGIGQVSGSGASNAGTIIINSGTITANGGTNSAGIGSGSGASGSGGDITINGGVVTAAGHQNGSGIGGGQNCSGGNITINGGTVTAIAGGSGTSSGIGCGTGGADNGTLVMNGNAFVTAYSASVANSLTANTDGVVNGVLFKGLQGSVYGSVYLFNNATVPAGRTLTVPSNTFLTVDSGITLTNNGTINVAAQGKLVVLGSISGGGTSGINANSSVVLKLLYNPGTNGAGDARTEYSSSLAGAIYTRDGYTQTGWSVNADGSTKDHDLNIIIPSLSIGTLYPVWTLNHVCDPCELDHCDDGDCPVCGQPHCPDPSAHDDNGLSGAAIAGISVGSTAAVCLGGSFALWWFVLRKRKIA